MTRTWRAVVVLLSLLWAPAAHADRTGGASVEDAASAAPASQSRPWNVEPTDDELTDAFLRALGPAANSKSKTLRRWNGVVEVEGFRAGSTDTKSSEHPSWQAFQHVSSQIEHATNLRFDVKQVADPSRSVRLRIRVSGIGIVLLDDYDSKKGMLRLATPGAEVSDLRAIYGGAARVRYTGNEITGASCNVNYHNGARGGHYLYFDLPVDILRTKGLSRSEIISQIDTSDASSAYNALQWRSIPAFRVLREYWAERGGKPDEKCLAKDYAARLQRIYAQCLSESLGLSWGGKLDELRSDTHPAMRKQILLAVHDILVEQSFRSTDYWIFAKYWPLLLGVLYDERIPSGELGPDTRAAVLQLIKEKRREFETELAPAEESCTGLAPF